MTRALYIDDDAQLRRLVQAGLAEHGFEVKVAASGEGGLSDVAADPPEVVIVDLGLPDVEGIEVVRRIRGFSDAPILILSARGAVGGKVEALDAGADDYLTKPFSVPELAARLRAIVRRRPQDAATAAVLRFGDIEVDLARRRVRRGGADVGLTPTERSLLERLVTNPGKLLTHHWLLREVWGSTHGLTGGYLRVYIRQLRGKLGDDAAAPRLIATETGVGYRWIPDPDD